MIEITPVAGEILMVASPVRRRSLVWHNTKKNHAVGIPFRMDKGIKDIPVVTMDWDDSARGF